MRALDAYRQPAADILKPLGAFVRADRAHALFVSDAPLRGATPDTYQALKRAGYTLTISKTTLRLTPEFEGVPDTLKHVYIDILKAQKDKAERLTRTQLAVALRRGHNEEIDFLTRLLNDILHEGS